MQERDNLLDVLKRTKKAFIKKDITVLNKLSNRTLHSSSIHDDADNIAVAVIVYALGKIIEREKYSEYAEWPQFFKICIKGIDSAISSVKKNDEQGFKEAITLMREEIDRISGKLKDYIEEVFRKASINKASRLYEHGISMQQTSSLLGITAFELAEYVGKTGIADVDLSVTRPIRTRIKYAEEIFK
jgi:hypothetical protein